MTADTLFSQVIPLRDYVHLNIKLGKENDDLEEEYEESENIETNQIISQAPSNDKDSLASDSIPPLLTDSLSKDSLSAKTDSLKIAVDSVKKDTTLSNPKDLKILKSDSTAKAQQLSKKAKKELKKQEKLAEKKAKAEAKKAKKEKKSLTDSLISNNVADSIPKDSLLKKSGVDSLKKDSLKGGGILALDSSLTVIPKGAGDSLLNEATKIALKAKPDSLNTDTGETRIVKAYHNVKIFKSDLQAIADSAYYGYADSVIRCFGKPIIWSQGSQLSADTVYMILKNQKMENILFDKNAFIVNTQLDSSKFNQVKGRKITGYFKNNELNRVYVDGNAESVYYTVEDNEYSGMVRSVSSRIKILFENKEMTDVISIRKAESTYYPIASIVADKEILEGFIWKPELRPKSKEEIISSIKPIVTEKKAIPDTTKLKEVNSSEIKEKETQVEDAPDAEVKQGDSSKAKKEDSNQEQIAKPSQEED